MAIQIEFLSKIVGFLRGTSDMSRALDKTQDALEDSARAARDLGDDLGDAISDGARDGRSAVDKLRDSMRDLDRSTGKVADTGRDGFRRMSDNVGEFKSEAKQNFAEVASSFDGSVDDMVGGVQGLTGGLGAALTPGIGIPVAVLGAVAASFLASWQQATEDSKTRVSDMYQAFLESGAKYLTEDQTRQAITDLADDAGKWDQALKIAEGTNLSIQTVLRAMVGDQDALTSAVAAENQAHTDKLTAISTGTLGMEEQAAAVLLENQRHQESIGLLQQIATDTDTAASKAAAVAGAFGTSNPVLDEVVRKLQDAAAKADVLSTTRTVTLKVDDSALEAALTRQQGRTISVNVDGHITRIGNQVW